MDRQQISLKLTLDVLHLPLKLDAFDDRMVLQKTIYLCQQAGVHLGYRYNWYRRGPYSPELTKDAFELKATQTSDFDEFSNWKLDDASVQTLSRISQMWSHKNDSERPRVLELLASVLYLRRSYSGRNQDATGLREVLLRNDKDFSESEIQNALQQLAQYGLLGSTS